MHDLMSLPYQHVIRTSNLKYGMVAIFFDRYKIGLFKTSWFCWDYGFARTVHFSVLNKSPYLVTLTRLDSCSELSSFAAGEPIGLAVFKDPQQDISSQMAYVYAFCQAQRVVVLRRFWSCNNSCRKTAGMSSPPIMQLRSSFFHEQLPQCQSRNIRNSHRR